MTDDFRKWLITVHRTYVCPKSKPQLRKNSMFLSILLSFVVVIAVLIVAIVQFVIAIHILLLTKLTRRETTSAHIWTEVRTWFTLVSLNNIMAASASLDAMKVYGCTVCAVRSVFIGKQFYLPSLSIVPNSVLNLNYLFNVNNVLHLNCIFARRMFYCVSAVVQRNRIQPTNWYALVDRILHNVHTSLDHS